MYVYPPHKRRLGGERYTIVTSVQKHLLQSNNLATTPTPIPIDAAKSLLRKTLLLVAQILDKIRPEKTAPTTPLRSSTGEASVEENGDPDGVAGDEDDDASSS